MNLKIIKSQFGHPIIEFILSSMMNGCDDSPGTHLIQYVPN